MQTSNNILRLAQAYLGVRRSPGLSAWDATPEPADATEAYGVQLAVMEALEKPVRGWKVALDAVHGPVAAPVDLWDVRRVQRSGAVHFELEVAVVLGADLPPRHNTAYTIDDIKAAISHVCCGVEFIRTRFGEDPDIPFLTGLADGLCHEGYILGDRGDKRDILEQAQFVCHVDIDGVKTDHDVAHPLRCPAYPILEYANCQIAGATALRAGQLVTTGSLCGLLAAAQPGRVEVAIEGVGSLAFDVE
jgi:hypothetical protein